MNTQNTANYDVLRRSSEYEIGQSSVFLPEWQETNEARRRGGGKKRRKFRSRRLAARITRGSGRFIRAARWNTTLGENCLENSLLHHGSCFPVTDILDRNLLENYFIILPFQSISSSVDHKYSNDQFSKSLVSFRNSCSSSKVRRHASNCRKSKATLACLRDDPGCCTQCLDKSYVPRCSESSQLYYL